MIQINIYLKELWGFVKSVYRIPGIYKCMYKCSELFLRTFLVWKEPVFFFNSVFTIYADIKM